MRQGEYRARASFYTDGHGRPTVPPCVERAGRSRGDERCTDTGVEEKGTGPEHRSTLASMDDPAWVLRQPNRTRMTTIFLTGRSPSEELPSFGIAHRVPEAVGSVPE